MPKAATRSDGRGRSAPKPSTASGRATRGGGGFAASSASAGGGLAQEGSAIPRDSAVDSLEAVVENSDDQDVSMVGSADAVVEAIEEIAAIETPDRRDDFEGIWRRLDRRLLLLAFGVEPDEVAGLPRIGVDGRPWLDGDTVEISLLVDAPVTTSIRASLEEAGLRIEGTDAARGIVVGRIPVARLFDLAALQSVRRATPSSGA